MAAHICEGRDAPNVQQTKNRIINRNNLNFHFENWFKNYKHICNLEGFASPLTAYAILHLI